MIISATKEIFKAPPNLCNKSITMEVMVPCCELYHGKHIPHQTTSIPIVVAKVDDEIVPLVNWFNDFSETHTLFCCQGNKPGTESDTGYVCFVTNEMKVLMKVSRLIAEFIEYRCPSEILRVAEIGLEVDYHDQPMNSLRFTVRFDNKQIMLLFTDYVIFHKVPPQWEESKIEAQVIKEITPPWLNVEPTDLEIHE